MPKGNEILLQLKAENKVLKSKLTQSKKQINELSDNVGKMNKKSKAGFASSKMAILGFVAAVGIAVGALKKIMALTNRQIEAENKRNAVLKATGYAAGLNADELNRMASGLQKVTTFGDEAVIEGQAILLTFKQIGKDVFPEATEAAMDMSVIFGQDLKQSMLQVGIALNDPIQGMSRLRRIGVTFTEEQKNSIRTFQEQGKVMEAQKVILAELNSEFGGVARAQVKTFAGRVQQLSNTFGDAGEKLGKSLIPALDLFLHALRDGGDDVGALTSTLQFLYKSLIVVVTGLGMLANYWDYAMNKAKINAATGAIEKHTSAMNKLEKELDVLRTKASVTGMTEDMDARWQSILRLQKEHKRLLELARADRDKYVTDVEGIEAKMIAAYQNVMGMEINESRFAEEEKANIRRTALAEEEAEEIAHIEKKKLMYDDYFAYIGEMGYAELEKEQEKYNALQEMHLQNKMSTSKIDKAFAKKMEIAKAKGDKKKRKADADYALLKIGMYNKDYEALAATVNAGASLMQSKNKALFKMGKAMSIASAIMNSAQAITKAWAQWGWPLGAVFGAITAAATGVQVGIIQSQEMPSYEKGHVPILANGSVPSDHYPAYIGSGEAVINEASTKNNRDLLNWINENPGQSASGGGVEIIQNNNISGNVLMDELVETLIVDKLEAMAIRQGTTLYEEQGV